MDRAKYVLIRISIIPKEFIIAYNLKDGVHNGYIFTRLTKGMLEIPQAGRIAHDDLGEHIEPYGYQPSSKTLVLWTHGSSPLISHWLLIILV